jgi:hypothetical protein
MGPISFIFNDKARIDAVVKKYDETDEDFYNLLKKYQDKIDMRVNGPVEGIEGKKWKDLNEMQIAQIFEVKEAFLETLDK